MSAPSPIAPPALDPAELGLGASQAAIAAQCAKWTTDRVAARLWDRDPTLWPQAPPKEVPDRCGWLDLPVGMATELPSLLALGVALRSSGIRHVVVLGMGGSSLAPDVFARMFPAADGAPQLLVLDSTHPAAVSAVDRSIDPATTFFLVSSKSGTTIEPLSFHRFFWQRLLDAGVAPGPQFAAITDPGTPLERLAIDQRFREVFRAVPTVGGRYSALTMFGLVPAALTGVDVVHLLGQARAMADACGPSADPPHNPGLFLGAALGTLAESGRDKLTFLAGPGVDAFPDWAEQLVAESTGKIGKGIVPVVGEPAGSPDQYDHDRIFVELQVADRTDPDLARSVDALQAAGHPVVRIRLRAPIGLGQEFFRWEVAVASAGNLLGIDPFDQPDVELAKELARHAMAGSADGGNSPGVPTTEVRDDRALSEGLARWIGEARRRDYVALQAYLAPSAETTEALGELRAALRRKTRLATTLGYGPRFLHSTGQLHKGGPNSGMFLQLVDRPAVDVPVPGADYTFGQLIRAQSIGDYQALAQKGRRVLRIDLAREAVPGIRRVTAALAA